MYKITNKTIRSSYKPFDIVTNKNNDVGIITEVSCNPCQPEDAQISYSVRWIVGEEAKSAWFDQEELTFHCNLFVVIAEETCHPMGGNDIFVKRFFDNTQQPQD